MTVDVEVLIRDHKKAISTIDGLEFHVVLPLLSQLREAVFGGMESTGSPVAAARLPISAGALDLLMQIDHQIAEVWAAAFNRVPSTDRAERLLAEWAIFIPAEKIVTAGEREWKADDLVTAWVVQIEDFFNPPRLAEIQAVCFVCGERWVTKRRDGEDVRSSALAFRRDRNTGETLDARCLACGTVWAPAQFLYLAQSIGASGVA